ncbi:MULTISPECIES: hypothetical protein [Halorubrum]|uniref:Uncharacterized protein n=1 Tax=Halorubrum tropicale TaxID=1765655 RepID=A0A0M9AQ64_9EURY|nr:MULTISPECIES: hypothetical protein [Halorubrum]KOX96619.1 hypothetical protein AMR74_09290 [Halorubrum tropicale]TKX44126.1 hypothetical protein EXE50_07145 [Halorubrum sp. ARQ200]TKX50966.1 hypothetical protein EXE49_04875 [Halorubrum sp. ASP121]TKX63457.1 hypothetical protein EXE48_00260 [Halorubrum sp. ASP1]
MGRRLLPGRRRGRDEAVVAMSGDGSAVRPTGDDAHGDFHETDARSPTVAVVASLAAAGVAATAGLVASPVGGALLGVAALGFLGGSLRRSTRVLTWGAAVGVVGLAVAGYRGATAEPLLVAAVGLAVAWDVADHGVGLGEQVGRGARVRRNVAVHAGLSLLVGALAAGLVYGVSLAVGGGQPVAALALLLAGGIALISALR